jgi:hypothetical protein
MIDPAPVLIIHLTAGYTPAGRKREISMIVNAQGFALAYSVYHPASNLRDALCPDSHVVTIGATPAEIRERKEMAAASGRMIPACGPAAHVRDVFASTLETAEQATARRLDAIQHGPPPLRPGYRWETVQERDARHAALES